VFAGVDRGIVRFNTMSMPSAAISSSTPIGVMLNSSAKALVFSASMSAHAVTRIVGLLGMYFM